MLTLVHKECGGPALEPNTSVGEVCAMPIERFPFACFTCLEEIIDESEVRVSPKNWVSRRLSEPSGLW